jgi:hypothetical protein
MAPEALPWKQPSPLYAAEMVWLPSASVLVVNVATPLLTVPRPSDVAPSKNSTVPVAFEGVIVAVNVSAAPYRAGLWADATLTALAAGFTIWVTLAALALKYSAPVYSAVMTRLLAAENAALKLAWPDAFSVTSFDNTVAP